MKELIKRTELCEGIKERQREGGDEGERINMLIGGIKGDVIIKAAEIKTVTESYFANKFESSNGQIPEKEKTKIKLYKT